MEFTNKSNRPKFSMDFLDLPPSHTPHSFEVNKELVEVEREGEGEGNGEGNRDTIKLSRENLQEIHRRGFQELLDKVDACQDDTFNQQEQIQELTDMVYKVAERTMHQSDDNKVSLSAVREMYEKLVGYEKTLDMMACILFMILPVLLSVNVGDVLT